MPSDCRSLRLATAGCLLAVLSAAAVAAPARFALLVGVTRYPNLEPGYQLRGPAADVRLVRRLATTLLAVPPENVVTLSEDDGRTGPSQLPTRENIDRAWHELGRRARPGDYLLIYLSGHGSQQPQPPEAAPAKLDGMDEVFLPRDAAAWDAAQGRIRGGIVDYEIGRWLAELRQRQVAVWMIVDACHSGTIIRDVREVARQVPPEALGIPPATLAAARARGAGRSAPALRGGPAARHGEALREPDVHLAQGPGIAALYACYPSEVTVEETLPRDAADAQPHGLFTFTLCRELTRAAALPGGRLTYRQLLGRICRSYAAMPRDTPQPLGEGDDLDREILGNRRWPTRGSIQLVSANKINAGLFRGLGPGSVLEVFADDRAEGRPVGHVRVTRAAAFEADVVPCEFNNLPAPSNLKADAACRPVYLEYGRQQLRVAVDRADIDAGADNDAKAASAVDRHQLELALTQATVESPLIEPVASPAAADWLVQPRAEGVLLAPVGQGTIAAAPQLAALHWAAADGPLANRLADALSRIARARNLVRLAAEPADDLANPADRPQIACKLWRRAADPRNDQLLEWSAGNVQLTDGDRCRLEVANTGDKPADINVFYVDSGYGISLLFPRNNAANRVEAGQTLPVGIKIGARTVGPEHVIVIALEGEGEGLDLSMLTQPPLDSTQPAAVTYPRAVRLLNSPLGRLMATTLYGRGNTRGQSRADLSHYSLVAIAWRVAASP